MSDYLELPKDGVCPKCGAKESIVIERDVTVVYTPRYRVRVHEIT